MGKVIYTGSVITVWLLATIACFQWARKKDENPAFMDFVGSLIFWPLILPACVVAAAIRTGWIYGARVVAWNDERKRPRQLRAGADNGLYD